MSNFKLSTTDIKSTKPSDYSVNRLYPNPKIKLRQNPPHIGIIRLDIITSPVYGSGGIFTWYSFPHGYDYIPSVIGVFISGTSSGILPVAFGAVGQIFIDADEKNVNIKFEDFGIGAVPLTEAHYRIRYYVFAEEGRQSLD